MKKNYGMVIDLDRCVNCQTCMVACQMEHGTPPRVFFTRVLQSEGGKFPRIQMRFFPILCNHCQNAPCEDICPAEAVYTNEDGVVLIDSDKCTGCGACREACPYNIPVLLERGKLKESYWGDELIPFEREKYKELKEGTVVKCDFCIDRMEKGMDPACVEACPTDTRVFGNFNDPESEVSHLLSSRGGRQPHPEFNTNPSVYYVG